MYIHPDLFDKSEIFLAIYSALSFSKSNKFIKSLNFGIWFIKSELNGAFSNEYVFLFKFIVDSEPPLL